MPGVHFGTVKRLKPLLRAIRNVVYRILYRGTGRWCPVCERSARRFAPFGIVRRTEAMCIHCGALERHRLIWLFFGARPALLGRQMRFLHVAPEPCLEPRLRARLGTGYVTGDLHDPRTDVRLDIMHIEYPEATFDVVYCSHVLEHVPDDRRAMREFHRVLTPGGSAIILVPVTVDRTIEDPSETDPKERLRRFGQDDHVRRYGPDIVERLKAARFAVEVVRSSDLVSEVDQTRMGLQDSGEIYFCTKP